MAAELSVLVELQRKDTEIKKLADSKKVLAAAVEVKEAELAQAKARLIDQEEELKTISKRRKNKEADLEDLAEKIGKLEGRLLKVATNKEYEATLTEMENIKALHSGAETELIRLMETEEEISAGLQGMREEVESRSKEVEEHKNEMRMELEHNERLLPAMRRHREEIAGKLSAASRSRYERIARSKNGLAVVAVAKGACGGCFTALPAQRINEIKIGDRLVLCEYCGRVLVWDEAPADEGAQA